MNDSCVEALELDFGKAIDKKGSCHSDREAQVDSSL